MQFKKMVKNSSFIQTTADVLISCHSLLRRSLSLEHERFSGENTGCTQQHEQSCLCICVPTLSSCRHYLHFYKIADKLDRDFLDEYRGRRGVSAFASTSSLLRGDPEDEVKKVSGKGEAEIEAQVEAPVTGKENRRRSSTKFVFSKGVFRMETWCVLSSSLLVLFHTFGEDGSGAGSSPVLFPIDEVKKVSGKGEAKIQAQVEAPVTGKENKQRSSTRFVFSKGVKTEPEGTRRRRTRFPF
ncbi:hypothetical protein NE237_031302 [Protea cynaroides]|uniref:Uncharacterized protein n=1 Tax=Protea cynaroides TaxID=273540 RepID=A0A9Q0L1C2_9MAGN|nr:hypothetical protein NE237_031302 [Protea cynaroides]